MSLFMLQDAIAAWGIGKNRPFSGVGTSELEEGAVQGLTISRPNIEVASLALFELEQRSRKAARNAEDNIRHHLFRVGHEPIPWLFDAREKLKYLSFEEVPNDNYTTSIYVILRDGYTKQNGRYGIYVGQTANTPEHRFEEHLNGINAGRGLQEHGLQLMQSLMWPWQKVPGGMNRYYETALHRALEIDNNAGPKVSGDLVSMDEWPEGFQDHLKAML
jgi:hypothetical protein